jgi:hypothetical protein
MLIGKKITLCHVFYRIYIMKRGEVKNVAFFTGMIYQITGFLVVNRMI